MADLASTIQEYRKRTKMSQTNLAEALGVSRTTILKWETGRAKPDSGSVSKLCDVLGITTGDLFGMPDEPDADEKRILALYRNLSLSNRRILTTLAETLQNEQARAMDEKLKEEYIVLGTEPTRAAAGSGTEYSDDICGYRFFKRTEANADADWVVGVTGSSMYPDYKDGDYVYVKETENTRPGDVVVVNTSEGLVIKLLNRKNQLESINPDYPYNPPADGAFRIIGKVVGKASPYDRPKKAEVPVLEELKADEVREFMERHGLVEA